MKARLSLTSGYIPAILTFVIFLLAWEALVPILGIPTFVLPTPSEVLAEIFNPRIPWLQEVLTTTYESLTGFGLAVVVGIGVAIVMALSRRFTLIAYPFIIAAQIIPKIAFVPILFIWLGFNDFPRIITVFLVCFFPIVIDTSSGLASLEEDAVDLIRIFSKSRIDLLVKAMLPAALPQIFSGLKVSITLAMIGALVAEFVSSNSGLGFIIILAQEQLNTELAFASATLLIAIGFVLYIALEWLEKVVVPWKPRRVVAG